MKKMFLVAMAVMLLSTVAMAAGTNMYGESGGYLVPDAQISQRLMVSTHYVDLNSTAAGSVSLTGGAFEKVEVGVTRSRAANINSNVYHAKLGFSFKQKLLKTSFALGARGADIQSLSGLNYFDYYLAGQFKLTALNYGLDITLGTLSSDANGKRKYTGFGLLGVGIAKNLSLYGEYKQNTVPAYNNWSVFVRRATAESFVDFGMMDAGIGQVNQVFFGLGAAL